MPSGSVDLRDADSLCSVSQLARALGLSRGRFYQLIRSGVFPPPVYDPRTRRPYYTPELQAVCRRIRKTGLDGHGRPVLFYTPRQQNQGAGMHKKPAGVPPLCQQLAEALRNLGLRDVSPEQVHRTLTELFVGQAIDALDPGVVLQPLYRYFKTGMSS